MKVNMDSPASSWWWRWASWMGCFAWQYMHKMSIFVEVVARVVHYQLTVGWQNKPKNGYEQKDSIAKLISGYFLLKSFHGNCIQLYRYQICDPIEVEPPNFRSAHVYESPSRGTFATHDDDFFATMLTERSHLCKAVGCWNVSRSSKKLRLL